MGGVVAFEMAQQLQRRGEQVAMLVLIDPSPASAASPEFEVSATEVATLFVQDVAALAGLDLDTLSPELSATDPEVLLQRLVETGREAGAPLPELSQLQALLRVFSANISALRHYTPSTYPGPVTLLHAGGSPDSESPDRGWEPLSSGGIALHEIPGDHYSLLRGPDVTVLAERLKTLLDGSELAKPMDTAQAG